MTESNAKVDAKAAKADANAETGTATGDAMQKLTDEAEDKGFYGVAVDETPKEHYTVAGVLAGKPTPEKPEGA